MVQAGNNHFHKVVFLVAYSFYYDKVLVLFFELVEVDVLMVQLSKKHMVVSAMIVTDVLLLSDELLVLAGLFVQLVYNFHYHNFAVYKNH